MAERLYVVDRIEGSSVIVIDEAGHSITVPSSRFPSGLREGTVLRVPVKAGTPDWGAAVVDRRETERRLDEGRNRLDERRRRDPGGDVTL